MSPLKMKSFLVVDNDAGTREKIVRLTDEFVCQAITAQNGQEALELSIHEGPFDLVIASAQMPHHIDGVEFARITKSSTPSTAIILMHGRPGQPGEYTKSHMIRVADYLIEKPSRESEWPEFSDNLEQIFLRIIPDLQKKGAVRSPGGATAKNS